MTKPTTRTSGSPPRRHATPAPKIELPEGTAADRLKAVGLMCIAITLFSGLDTSAKFLETHVGLPVVQIVWARFAGQFLLMLSFLGALPLRALFGTRKLSLELVRSLLMVSTTACNFLALQYLRLDQTVTVVFLAPLVVACGSSEYALPIVILMRSAVCSPMAMLYLRFM